MSERWAILVVGDSDDDRAAVRRALHRGSAREYDFTEVHTGADTLKVLSRLSPTCLILDYSLPDMTAPELLTAISRRSGSLCPVVVLTGDHDPDQARQVLRAGAMDHLGKGWMNDASLSRAVENAVERQALLRERDLVIARLHESDARARLAMEASGTGFWEWNVGTGAVTLSQECYGIFGIATDAFDGSAAGFDRLLYPDDRDRVWEAVRAAVEQGTRYDAEFRIVRPDGEVRWVYDVGRALYDERGPARMLGTVTDITDRKASEAALRESQQRLAATQAHAPIGIVELTLEGRYTNVNEAFCNILGYTRDELLGRTFSEITFAPDRARSQELFERLTAGAIPSFRLEKRFIRRDGTLVWVDVHRTLIKSGIGTPLCVMGAIVDLTHRKRAEEALRTSEERFRILTSTLPQLVWEADAQGLCTYQGPQWDWWTGQSAQAALGTGWLERIHPSDRERTAADWRAAGEGGRGYEGTYRLQRADGSYRWCVARAQPVRDASGAIVRWVGTTTDIEEIKRSENAARESEAILQSFYDSAPMLMGIAELDGDRTVAISGNRAMAAFLATSAERLPGQSGLGLGTPPDVDRLWVEGYRRAQLIGEPVRFEFEYPRATGSCWLSATATFIGLAPTGRPRFSFVVEDVTARKRAETLLLDAAQQKDEFIAMLAHELRNPLAPVRTAVALLRARGPADPLVVRCGDVIDRQAAQMARLLDDLLDVSRLSRGRLVLQRGPVVLQDVIDAAAETARPHIEQQQHELVLAIPETPILLDGDAARLTQVLSNLLNNAAKFTPPHGRITITVRSEEESALVVVRDTGCGIALEEQERIFGLFSQTRDERTASTGLGIGLALARQLVEMHGGSVGVSSDGPGKGAEFAVRLPLTRRAASKPDDPAPTCIAPLGHRVVVVDDNIDAAVMLATWLEALGCEVRTVTDGTAAVQEIERFRPDVAFIDLGMPGMDGYEVCRRIGRDPWRANVTLVALTGWGQEEDRRRSASAGFDHHLLKSADLEGLVELLRDIKPGVRN